MNDRKSVLLAFFFATNDDAVTLIADLAGFNSRSYFNRLFRERNKPTPSEYRKMAKENA